MKKVILLFIQLYFRVIQLISPKRASQMAINIFFSPAKTKKRFHEIMEKAKQETVLFDTKFKLKKNGNAYVKYSWGKGKKILLVHGWAGKASHFTKLIEMLTESGYRVIAFDAPAHGQSPGEQSNLPEFSQIIAEIAEKENGLFAVIGHSLGGIASALAIKNGLEVSKLITLGSPTNMDFIFTEYSKALPINTESRRRVERFIEEIANSKIDDFSLDRIINDIHIPITVFHDKNDQQVPYYLAKNLKKKHPKITLISTHDLGHQKVLFDEKVIRKILSLLKSSIENAK